MIATIAKQLVLKTTSLGVYVTVSALLHRAISKVMPTKDFNEFLQKFNSNELNEDVRKEEIVKAAIKWIGITVVIAIVSTAIANKAEDLVETTFWSETIDQIQS